MRERVTHLSSALGVTAVLLTLVVANYCGNFAKRRVDLTADREFTLAPETLAILADLDTPVQIRLYATRDPKTIPTPIALYANRVEDLLSEYREASGGLVAIERIDPAPDSEAEEMAKIERVEPQERASGESYFLGLCVSMLDRKQPVPFLAPERERQLEYDITRAISLAASPKKPVIGFLSPLPIEGVLQLPFAASPGSNQPPWTLFHNLKAYAELRRLEPGRPEIPGDLTALLVIHPTHLGPADEYAIDQFVLRGGKLAAFVDPICAFDSRQPGSASQLATLFRAWNVDFSLGFTLADPVLAAELKGQKQPTWLSLDAKAFNPDDPLTASANNAVFIHAGAWGGPPAPGLSASPLAQSSDAACLVSSTAVGRLGGISPTAAASPQGRHTLALRLHGMFASAFPDGPPDGTPPGPRHRTRAESPNTVLLFGDVDFLCDEVAVRETPAEMGQQRKVVPANGNLALAENAVALLSGDRRLITLRNRTTRQRPFRVVRELQQKAAETFQSRIDALESDLQAAKARLVELESPSAGGTGPSKVILSPEQQAELAAFQARAASVHAELRSVRRELRREVDALEHRVKWANLAIAPGLLVALALATAFRRRKSP
jgi:ABC-type uncharacterized transport system involved in gliding motility auxiliary subunit